MAKFLKTWFHSSDKKRSSKSSDKGLDEANDFTPPYDGRRKLSISRSGRMKQNKKRASMTQELFGEANKVPEKPNIAYHVHGKNTKNRDSTNNNTTQVNISIGTAEKLHKMNQETLKMSAELPEDDDFMLTPEEASLEIESAFKIIEK